jgi:hypothetical protein
MNPLIESELVSCRQAWQANPSKSAWCCHHGKLWEWLTEPYDNRIAYILSDKPEHEQAVRLRNFRPCSQHDKVDAIDAKYWTEWDAIDAKWQTEWNALDAKYQPEWDAIHAKYQPEWDAIYAKYWAERDALDAKWQTELMKLYKLDVPLGTWNGNSIFAKEG